MTQILHIIKMLSRGGATHGMINTARTTAATGKFKHSVISLVQSEPEANILALEAGMEVLNAPTQERFCQKIRENDIVQVHFWNTPEMYSILNSELPEMRLLIRFNVNGHFAPHVITRDLIDFADHVLVANPFAYEAPAFREMDTEKKKEKTSLLYATTDFSKFQDIALKAHQGFNVGYIGTVDFIKMHPDFVKLSAQIDIPDVRFIVCGKGSDLHILKRQVSNLHLEDRFSFLGYINNIQSVYEKLDVFGYPLCEDNYSTVEFVLQEAMYLGIPSVIFPHGGAQKTVEHNFSGLIVNSDREYKEAIEYLYYHPGERHRLGENAKRSARQLFNSKTSAEEYISIYNTLLDVRKRKRRLVNSIDIPHTVENQPGACHFLQSLGTVSSHFSTATDITSTEADIKKAEGVIGQSSELLYRHGLSAYREVYPNDRFLLFWSGLFELKNKKFVSAYNYFIKAEAQGFPSERCQKQKKCIWETIQKMDKISHLEILISDKDWEKAQELLTGVLTEKIADESELKRLYKIALEFDHRAHLVVAKKIYEYLLTNLITDQELSSWIHFKLGEVLHSESNYTKAKEFFRKAVELRPDHTKAQIYLATYREMLRVAISPQPLELEGHISVNINICDQELWNYYFTGRSIDLLHTFFLYNESLDDFSSFLKLVNRYLAETGKATVEVGETFLSINNRQKLQKMAARNHLDLSFETCTTIALTKTNKKRKEYACTESLPQKPVGR